MDEELEQKIVKEFAKKDKRKTTKMHVSGKSVFNLKKIIEQRPKASHNNKSHDSSPKRKNTKKNR